MTYFNTHARPLRMALLSVSMLAVTACTTVGPDYGGAPEMAPVSVERGTFLRAPDEASRQAPASDWWTQFDDPVLTQLVEDALSNAPSIDAAFARVTQARAGLQTARTAALPSVGSSVSTPYINVPADLVDSDSNRDRYSAESLSVGFDASWELDLFGGNRRRLEAGAARLGASEASLADAQVSLSAEVARIYIGLRARQEMASVLQQQLGMDRQLLVLARQRHEQGTATLHPVEQYRSAEAQTLADIARNEVEIAVAMDQLAVLSGFEPGALNDRLADQGAAPLPPAEIAIGSPADLLRKRPDIRQAERNLAAANADIGVNVADRFPKVSFLGLLGLGGGSIGEALDPANLIGLALPRISWSVFDGGRTEARIEASRGAFAEAEANYRGTVLAALGDAENALTRFGGARVALARTLDTRESAQRVATLDTMRAQAGTIAHSQAIASDREVAGTELASITAKAELAEAYIAVNKAMGFGWSYIE
ncbi:efflux transporter outer membrane subunit [Qipengyuania flava]|uniref:efflux transporter outer membrane subunit n=1 Tax=Qipengyuania flava TaxID=192812 RepID=UPI00141ABCDA|nr:efflux transporter outer membrane subunit [Qipengyuania flava]NIJ61674.1 NodT family efflux transporter outer membrane factor (OMF) lipoprotein [Qipengyuania flava]